MKKLPLVSFCVATYKRTEFLKMTLESILSQTYDKFEVIVTDNDVEGSARSIVKKLRSPKIRYYTNPKNLGMVANFNRAFGKAKGDFIVFMSDDDPICSDMLETLINLYKNYPGYDNYFGACYVQFKQDAKSMPSRILPLRNKFKKSGQISTYASDTFLKHFFSQEILPYFLWSTGMTRRTVALKAGGMPDFGSPFLTDFAYIAEIGSLGKTVVINKELGYQTIHTSNFGQSVKILPLLEKGIKGFHDIVYQLTASGKDRRIFMYFLNSWLINHLIFIYPLYGRMKHESKVKQLMNFYDRLSNKYPELKKRRTEVYLRLNYQKPFNFLFLGFHFLRRIALHWSL